MNCAGCGEVIQDNITVCSHCSEKATEIISGKRGVAFGWKTWLFVLFIIISILVPLLGIILGVYGLLKNGKQTQGFILLVLSVIVWSINMKLFY